MSEVQIYSKGTDNIFRKFKDREIPAGYFHDDDYENFESFMKIISEMLTIFKMTADDLYNRKNPFTTRKEDLDILGANFGFNFDENIPEQRQRAFLNLISEWIRQKGTAFAIVTFLALYDIDSEVEELRLYMPTCGDEGLIVNPAEGCDEADNPPYWQCGMLTLIPPEHVLYAKSTISRYIRINYTGYPYIYGIAKYENATYSDESQLELARQLTRKLDFFLPIYILLEPLRPFEALWRE